MDNYTLPSDKNKEQFLSWEASTRDTIDFKKLYVDMADDLIAGLLLSQIVFWFLPNKQGQSKLRVIREGEEWLVRGRDDWWEECRIKPRQYDLAIKKLVECGVLETKIFKFNGETKIHIRIVWNTFLEIQNKILNPPSLDTHGINESVNRDLHTTHVNRDSRIGESGITDRGIALTEIVTEISSLSPLQDERMNECMNDDPDTPILKILQSKLNLQDQGINISKTYLSEIFMMLHMQFPKNINAEVVTIACDLFVKEYVKANKFGDFKLENPVGWFHEQYQKAIIANKAKKINLQ